MLDDKDIELVRRFHESDLSEGELDLMVQKIEADPSFKEEVEKLGLVRNTIIRLIEHEQKITLGNNIGELGNKRSRLLALAAFVLLLLGCFAYYQFSFQEKEQIFADCETFTYAISEDVMRTENPSGHTAILNAADEATLQNIMEEYEDNNSSLAEKEALALKNTSQDMNTQEIVAWWLVTIYLKEERKEEARIILEEIIRQPDFNSGSNASDIMNSL